MQVSSYLSNSTSRFFRQDLGLETIMPMYLCLGQKLQMWLGWADHSTWRQIQKVVLILEANWAYAEQKLQYLSCIYSYCILTSSTYIRVVNRWNQFVALCIVYLHLSGQNECCSCFMTVEFKTTCLTRIKCTFYLIAIFSPVVYSRFDLCHSGVLKQVTGKGRSTFTFISYALWTMIY